MEVTTTCARSAPWHWHTAGKESAGMDRQAAIDRLELAVTDPNPTIRGLAEDLLGDLEQDST